MSRQALALSASITLLLVVPVVDYVAPLGYAVWVLYFVAIGVTLFQDSPRLPWIMAGVSVALIGWGMWVSPPGISMAIAATNRVLGAFACVFIAGVVWRVLQARRTLAEAAWLQRGQLAVADALLGEQPVQALAVNALRTVCRLVGADVGALYRMEGGVLELAGTHGTGAAAPPAARIASGEGLLGAAVRETALVVRTEVPAGHLTLASSLGRSEPAALLLTALRAEGAVVGALELGFVRPPRDGQAEALVERIRDTVGLTLRTALLRERTEALLAQTQAQSEELQAQQEELRVTNEDLLRQTEALRDAQTRLETQQVELEQTNDHLSRQAGELEQREEMLLQARDALQANTLRLEAASRYKSEFLANMSHELRTPLNSSLILARLLADNREGRLGEEQVRWARTILDANNDLLALINDVLDLSKIEAGHLTLAVEPVPLAQVAERIAQTMEPLARHKGLSFAVELAPGLPDTVVTDGQRLQQILKNLLSNAVKFTEAGSVTLVVAPAGADTVGFAVRDTGIGIPRDQQETIFEAFRQADGSTSRRFGGTGLGLSISRELAHRLGGEIRVDSEPGRGSTFTLRLPASWSPAPARAAVVRHDPPTKAPAAAPRPAASMAGDPPPRPATVPASPVAPDGERLILVVEDDPRFADIVVRLAEEMRFRAQVCGTAAEAIAVAGRVVPSAVLLDVGLPDGSGLAVLDALKHDPRTRHVPVHVVSVRERLAPALEMGAIGHLVKPATREQLLDILGDIERRLRHRVRRVLLVEDDERLCASLVTLLAADDVEVVPVGTVSAAIDALRARTFDCLVTDLALPDGSGHDLLERMAREEHLAFPPVIVYTGRALDRDEEQRLRRWSDAIIVKGARSPERLLDEVTLFLHSVEARMPPDRRRLLEQARARDAVLEGRRLLLAEDDVRNVFALTTVLEPLGVRVEVARNGREAVERAAVGDIDLVLMDIMMPEMDGLEAIRRIRGRQGARRLPIIALTAKAMPDDRDRCLAAGADDYLPKPIDFDRLLSLCRVWCPR